MIPHQSLSCLLFLKENLPNFKYFIVINDANPYPNIFFKGKMQGKAQLEEGVFKFHKGSEKLKKKNPICLVGFDRQYNSDDARWETHQYPKKKFVMGSGSLKAHYSLSVAKLLMRTFFVHQV